MDLTPYFRAEGAGSVRLTGSRCPACGTHHFPARIVCASCSDRSPEPATLSGRGRVRVRTRVEAAPWGFDEPIDVAVVELAEGPTVFALLAGPAEAGTEVLAVPHPVRAGAPGFAFRSVA
ncbi:hypothetical protein PZ61_0235715 [Streptomyces sp. MNU77]|uniref:Zn-ribbon domain-containing OB-fold protein n=1 Tax=Streptomyces sp. MNU77 TaxID=1573406 RepID=UPI0006400071|nr:zinc ribbon domain-containing protein [Streptomyces sp. MNU77]OLO25785.1 hypothetical protein PZ61_0235715 [Streptomyces sp. MNU77]